MIPHRQRPDGTGSGRTASACRGQLRTSARWRKIAAVPLPHRPISRRTFVAALTGGLLAAPLAAGAQPPRKVYRLGFLGNSTAALESAPSLLLRADRVID